MIAIGATLALALTGFVGIQSANAAKGVNCNLKSTPKMPSVIRSPTARCTGWAP